MKTIDFIKKIKVAISAEDFLMVFGEPLCLEFYKQDSINTFYVLTKDSIATSIGVALSLPRYKKVFAFLDVGVLFNNLDSIMQIFLYNIPNLYLFIVQDPDVMEKQLHLQGVFFNIGIQSFNITSYFNNKESLKNLKNFIYNLAGPKVFVVDCDKSRNTKKIVIEKLDFFTNRFNYNLNKSIGAI